MGPQEAEERNAKGGEGKRKSEEDGWMDVRYMLPQKGLQVFHQRLQRKNRERERGALK